MSSIQNAGIISRNDFFHPRKSEIARRSDGFHNAAQFGEWVRAIFLIPVSPRVILATFERRKCRQRFCIRPLLQFIRACARTKRTPARKEYVYIRWSELIHFYEADFASSLCLSFFFSFPPLPLLPFLPRALFPQLFAADSLRSFVGGTVKTGNEFIIRNAVSPAAYQVANITQSPTRRCKSVCDVIKR